MLTRSILTNLLCLCLGTSLVACDDGKAGPSSDKLASADPQAKQAEESQAPAKAAPKAPDMEAPEGKLGAEGKAVAANGGADSSNNKAADVAADGKPAAAPSSDAKDPAQPGDHDEGSDSSKPKPTTKKPPTKPSAREKKPPKPVEPAPTPASTVDGQSIYLKKCKACHAVSGDGSTKLGKKYDIPSWKEPGWKGKWPLAKVKDIVINGKSGTKMRAFKTKLSPEEIDAVSVYARKLGR